MRESARKIAQAIRTGAQAHAERRGPGRYRATVERWDGEQSFALDVHGEDLPALDEGDVTLTQAVRRYDADNGIAAGDVIILLELGTDDAPDFSAVAVESDTDTP